MHTWHSLDLPKDSTSSQLSQHLVVRPTHHLHLTLVHNVHLSTNFPLRRYVG